MGLSPEEALAVLEERAEILREQVSQHERGLMAPNGQAAQGMSMIAFVFAFISSTYVPVSTMPGWLQPFAKYQPITPMVDADPLSPGPRAALAWR